MISDKVTPKFKKNGEIKSVKILINSKDYKAKKDEFSYDSGNQQILFKGSNLSGSYNLHPYLLNVVPRGGFFSVAFYHKG